MQNKDDLWSPFSICSLAPAMLRQASYGTIKIGTYQSFKRLLVDNPEGKNTAHSTPFRDMHEVSIQYPLIECSHVIGDLDSLDSRGLRGEDG